MNDTVQNLTTEETKALLPRIGEHFMFEVLVNGEYRGTVEIGTHINYLNSLDPLPDLQTVEFQLILRPKKTDIPEENWLPDRELLDNDTGSVI